MAGRKNNTRKHARSDERERRSSLRMSRTQKQIAVIIAVIILAFTATYGRKIYKLKKENVALKQQQAELKKEKSRLTKELKNINSKDYIEEQARKKLRLLNKDEIMFIFKDEYDE